MPITVPDANDYSTGAILKRARLKTDLYQTEVADLIGIPKWTYIALEHGRGLFDYEWLALLPRAYRQSAIRDFKHLHYTEIEHNREALKQLDKLLEADPPEDEAESPKRFSRPTASSPSL